MAALALVLALCFVCAPFCRSLICPQNATTAAYEIADLFRQARGFAIANNTHVFVGILEENASARADDPPPRTGIGRVVVALFSSVDGTKGYENEAAPQTSWADQYANGHNLRPLGKVRRFENLHLAASLGAPPESGAMARPDVSYYYRLGHSNCSSVTPITWPIGSGLNGGFTYRFDKVIRFDPRGTPRIQYKTNSNTIVLWMEIGLQQTHGNAWAGLPSGANSGNQIALLINGITGTTRIYRPGFNK